MIFRPSNLSLQEFMPEFPICIDSLYNSTHRATICIAGDFNINLLKVLTQIVWYVILLTLCILSFFPTITRQTRLTSSTATLIDDILINNSAFQRSRLICAEVSGYLDIFANFGSKLLYACCSLPKQQTIPSRYLTSYNILLMHLAYALGILVLASVKLALITKHFYQYFQLNLT